MFSFTLNGGSITILIVLRLTGSLQQRGPEMRLFGEFKWTWQAVLRTVPFSFFTPCNTERRMVKAGLIPSIQPTGTERSTVRLDTSTSIRAILMEKRAENCGFVCRLAFCAVLYGTEFGTGFSVQHSTEFGTDMVSAKSKSKSGTHRLPHCPR